MGGWKGIKPVTEFQSTKSTTMAGLLGSLATGMQVVDIGWEMKCREEELRHRDKINARRLIDDVRRRVDEKTAQLQAISQLSALIAGFSMMVLVEATVPEGVNVILLTAYGATTAMVVALMLMAMINCTLMLIALLKHDCSDGDLKRFMEFWNARFERDWEHSFMAFKIGVPLFLVVLSLLGWVIFHNHRVGTAVASVISIIAVFAVIIWFGHTKRQWTRTFDPPSVANIYTT